MIDYYVRVAPRAADAPGGPAADAEAVSERRRRAVLLREALPAARARRGSQRAAGEIPYCVVDGLASLVWVANLASLELHPSLALATAPDVPTVVAFDLDPGAPADVVDCAAAGRRSARHARRARTCECFAKTSGSKGMQVYVPLNTPSHVRGDAGLLAGRRA